MNSKELIDKVNNISIWKRGDQRAPHKPLLILIALRELKADKSRLLSYEEVKDKLKNLLIDFGPYRKSYHPEHPFVRLENDDIWELNKKVEARNIRNNWLIENEVLGGFTEEVYYLLKNNNNIIEEIAYTVLQNHFPETIHEDILNSIGLDFNTKANRKRNPYFRDKILRAYEYKCAICGFNVRLGHTLVAVEAAHIKWHQAGGPDNEENGIALCSMHHKLFDRGVFTLTKEKKLIVAEEAHGTKGFDEWLMRYHNKKIQSPINPEYKPRDMFINWHIKEVFRGPARYTV